MAVATSALSTGILFAESITVKGVLENSAGEPLAGYPIVIFEDGKQSGSNWVAITDNDGSFYVPGIPEGNYMAVPAGDASQRFPFELKSTTNAKPLFSGKASKMKAKTDAEASDIGVIKLQSDY